MQLDVNALGDMIADLIADAVEQLEKANAELRKEIDALKAREPDRKTIVEATPVEIDVSDVVKELLAADEIRQLVALEVEAYLTENPPPPGKDGKEAGQVRHAGGCVRVSGGRCREARAGLRASRERETGQGH